MCLKKKIAFNTENTEKHERQTVLSCMNKCQEKGWCVAFSFVGGNKVCQLKNTVYSNSEKVSTDKTTVSVRMSCLAGKSELLNCFENLSSEINFK